MKVTERVINETEFAWRENGRAGTEASFSQFVIAKLQGFLANVVQNALPCINIFPLPL